MKEIDAESFAEERPTFQLLQRSVSKNTQYLVLVNFFQGPKQTKGKSQLHVCTCLLCQSLVFHELCLNLDVAKCNLG